jgi:hypothetical protein
MKDKTQGDTVCGKRVSRETRTITLAPLKLEEALAAVIATGPITDPKLKRPKGQKRRRKKKT